MLKNTLKTFTLLAGLAGFFVLVGSLLGGLTGLMIGGAFGFVLVGSSYWFSDRLGVKAARASEVQPGELEGLRSDLAVLADRAGIATPRLFISPDDQPNAFATGRNERTAIVCVTAGLLAAHRVAMDVSPMQATAYIVNPLTGRDAKLSNLFLTHPPTDARVRRLLADHHHTAVAQ